ncbi:hypothetical protein A8G00_11335 [Sphingobium sp. SA916]|jgi:hypothetical protein|nr:hypothetical protein A8G00_11335 [Sphingobium sp. SA916]
MRIHPAISDIERDKAYPERVKFAQGIGGEQKPQQFVIGPVNAGEQHDIPAGDLAHDAQIGLSVRKPAMLDRSWLTRAARRHAAALVAAYPLWDEAARLRKARGTMTRA